MRDLRYKNLKEENDKILLQLTGKYQHLANIYIKKARGYAVKNIDTEMKINDTLLELDDYDSRNVSYENAITNDNLFIENHIELLSKELKDPNRWKTILGLTLIALFIILWGIISIWMRQETPGKSPQNLSVEKISNTQVKVKWDEVDFATEGYFVWKVDSQGHVEGKYHTLMLEYIFDVEPNNNYTFYVQTKKTQYLGESKAVSIEYKN